MIVGPDQIRWKKELEALAERLGIASRITWTGSLAGTLKWGAFSASEAFVLPSHQENFGIVVAEALACSLPVIVSNKVQSSSGGKSLPRTKRGWIGEDTMEGTTASLRRWAGLTAEAIAAFRICSRACFENEFDFNHTSRKVLENVEQLARATPRYKPPGPAVSTPGI